MSAGRLFIIFGIVLIAAGLLWPLIAKLELVSFLTRRQ